MRKSYRVKTEKDFQRVFKQGQSKANRAFVIYWLPREDQKHFRVGISVGKKVGHTAVARNRLKRYIRATLTELKAEVSPDLDFLVIARPYARNFNMVQTRKNLIHALSLAHVIPTRKTEAEEN
ncbi:ribonuclease P protein component [Lactobacillus sp. PV037]|uniref:ribonuclease P protein component n=1 Tax=unclassified Lactobacillus TaxID=2620435 RepID=UPI002240B704|nr:MULTISPECIES: ribonuclease P protein component [unclassified Lactobacillus]QNQ81594.1 ribonuclease P protein component [Lactobacillus sp. PV012]QNQ84359.1 ribonuclease P protein component [Lactobacillus sp. PV037]